MRLKAGREWGMLRSMRTGAIVIGCVLLAGCHQAQKAEKPEVTDPAKLARLRAMFVPAAYARPEDQKRAERLRNGYSGPLPCEFEKIEGGAPVIASLPTEQCYKMTPPQQMTGLWRNDFEGSQFCPAPAQKCPNGKWRPYMPDVAWLEFVFDLPGLKDTPPGGLYAIDFIGRRTAYPGRYGEYGFFIDDVTVDRLISIKEVEPPPQQPTVAQMKAYDKACEANHTCISIGNEPDEADYARMQKGHVEDYFKDCAGRPICIPNSWAVEWKKKHPGEVK